MLQGKIDTSWQQIIISLQRFNIMYINSTIHCCTDWVQQLCSAVMCNSTW